nr:MAG TPA: hypothetical protein [Caudoviricetes sp.]
MCYIIFATYKRLTDWRQVPHRAAYILLFT